MVEDQSRGPGRDRRGLDQPDEQGVLGQRASAADPIAHGGDRGAQGVSQLLARGVVDLLAPLADIECDRVRACRRDQGRRRACGHPRRAGLPCGRRDHLAGAGPPRGLPGRGQVVAHPVVEMGHRAGVAEGTAGKGGDQVRAGSQPEQATHVLVQCGLPPGPLGPRGPLLTPPEAQSRGKTRLVLRVGQIAAARGSLALCSCTRDGTPVPPVSSLPPSLDRPGRNRSNRCSNPITSRHGVQGRHEQLWMTGPRTALSPDWPAPAAPVRGTH